MLRFLVILIGLFFVTGVYALDTFRLSSPVLSQNGTIPKFYTCRGKNTPPPLYWTDPPPNTEAFALVFSSPDAAVGGTSYDWLLYNIPPETRSLTQGTDKLPKGTMVGKTTSGDPIYYGPCPPDKVVHKHIFTLYALDGKLNLIAEAEPDDVMKQIRQHAIGQTQLIVYFKY